MALRDINSTLENGDISSPIANLIRDYFENHIRKEGVPYSGTTAISYHLNHLRPAMRSFILWDKKPGVCKKYSQLLSDLASMPWHELVNLAYMVTKQDLNASSARLVVSLEQSNQQRKRTQWKLTIAARDS